MPHTCRGWHAVLEDSSVQFAHHLWSLGVYMYISRCRFLSVISEQRMKQNVCMKCFGGKSIISLIINVTSLATFSCFFLSYVFFCPLSQCTIVHKVQYIGLLITRHGSTFVRALFSILAPSLSKCFDAYAYVSQMRCLTQINHYTFVRKDTSRKVHIIKDSVVDSK